MDAHRAALAALAHNVRGLRKDRGWTRSDLARHAQLSVRFLADIETGGANPSLSSLFSLADTLGTTPGALLAAAAPLASAAARRVVALLGLRGAGKSSIGSLLAEQLGVAFVELDARVEAASGMRLAQIFEFHGEAFYRDLERRVLADILHEPQPMVLATGGGLVTVSETFTLLRRHTHTVWLRARPEDHWNRVVGQGDLRPMADHEHAFAQLCTLLNRREKLYCQAELTVATSGRSPEEVARELAARFRTLAAEPSARPRRRARRPAGPAHR